MNFNPFGLSIYKKDVVNLLHPFLRFKTDKNCYLVKTDKSNRITRIIIKRENNESND